MPAKKVPDSTLTEISGRVHRRQIERPVPGVPGLRIAVYPSGRRTYIYRFRDPVTGRKTSQTLGPAD